jgi:hypothetical protein
MNYTLTILAIILLLFCKCKTQTDNKLTVKRIDNPNHKSLYCDINLIEFEKYNVLEYNIINGTDEKIILIMKGNEPRVEKFLDNRYIAFNEYFFDRVCSETYKNDSVIIQADGIMQGEGSVNEYPKLKTNHNENYVKYYNKNRFMKDSAFTILSENFVEELDRDELDLYLYLYIYFLDANDTIFDYCTLKKEFPVNSKYKIFFSYILSPFSTCYIPRGSLLGYNVVDYENFFTDTLYMEYGQNK